MNSGCSGTTNDLDQIRRCRGCHACRTLFRKLGKECRQQAARLVNDSRLSFTCLYILQHEIEELNLREELSGRNQIALNICEKLRGEENSRGTSDGPIPMNSEEAHRVLLWVFQTGAPNDGLDNEFDKILDVTAAVLTKTYHDKQVLPLMIDTIFKRNQRGRYIHDLVWACFQARDMEALRLIAEYLRSSDSKDVDLARTLLHLPQDVPLTTSADRQRQYAAYRSWLKENDPYIHFTSESFQYTNSPIPCVVDWNAKYLGKDGSVSAFEPLTPPSDTGRIRFTDFDTLAENEKEILAGYSQKLRSENPFYWNQWMQFPVDKQLQIARHGGGDSYDYHR